MAKFKLVRKEEPVGKNLYIINVIDSISKSKTVLVYADWYVLDDEGNVAFINKCEDGEDYVFTIRSGDWKSIVKHEDCEEHIKSVRFMTIQERLEEILFKELEKEEAIKKAAIEEELAKLEAEEAAAKTKAEELKASIKE